MAGLDVLSPLHGSYFLPHGGIATGGVLRASPSENEYPVWYRIIKGAFTTLLLSPSVFSWSACRECRFFISLNPTCVPEACGFPRMLVMWYSKSD